MPKHSSSGFAVRLALFYAAIFLVIGIHMPFFPVWLEAKGLDPRDIGLVLALPMLLRVVAVPVASRLADRYHALRGALLMASLGGMLGYGLLGLADGVTAILIVFALASLAYTPVMPLTEAYAVKGLARRSKAYGPVRLWGSVAFVVGTLGAGFLLDVIPPLMLIWLIVAALLITLGSAIALEPLHAAVRLESTAPSHIALWRNPGFLTAAGAAAFIQGSHSFYNGFSTLDWQATGFSMSMIGALWAIGVLAEIVLFAFQGRLPASIDARELMLIGAAASVLRWIALTLDPPAWSLPVLQLLHGLSFGATHLATIALVARAAPERQGATAQGDLSIILAVVMAGGTVLSGWLFQNYGHGGYAAMIVAALLGFAVALIGQRYWRG